MLECTVRKKTCFQLFQEDATLETDAELDAAIQKKLKNADLSEVRLKIARFLYFEKKKTFSLEIAHRLERAKEVWF